MNKKISTPLAILIILLVITAIIGIALWICSIKNIVLPQDETADWNTYRDQKYGFEIKYPEKWKVEIEETSILFIDTAKTDISYPEGLLIFTINIGETTFNSIYEWFNKEFQDRSEDLVPEYSGLIIDENQALRFSDPISMGGCEEIIVSIKNLGIYKLNRTGLTCEYSNELFNQMLSTFRFLEEDTEDENADWETYSNEEYRFEFRYPKDWRIVERGDNYAYAKSFYIEKITKDPRYIFPPDIVITPIEGSEPDSFYSSFVKVQKREFDFAGRKATAWLFLTEEGDVWRLIIKNIPDLPENWDEDTAIHVSYPVYPEKGKNCEYGDQFIYSPIHLESIKVSCAVDKEESEFFNQILSTFRFLE